MKGEGLDPLLEALHDQHLQMQVATAELSWM
jgi:hypothetical protein